MVAPRVLYKTELETMFRAGRFQKSHTMQAFQLGGAIDIGGSQDMPVEAGIADADNNHIGACWISDIDHLLSVAEAEGDTEETNPNLAHVKEIYMHMIEARRRLNQPYDPKSQTAKKLAPPVVVGLAAPERTAEIHYLGENTHG